MGNKLNFLQLLPRQDSQPIRKPMFCLFFIHYLSGTKVNTMKYSTGNWHGRWYWQQPLSNKKFKFNNEWMKGTRWMQFCCIYTSRQNMLSLLFPPLLCQRSGLRQREICKVKPKDDRYHAWKNATTCCNNIHAIWISLLIIIFPEHTKISVLISKNVKKKSFLHSYQCVCEWITYHQEIERKNILEHKLHSFRCLPSRQISCSRSNNNNNNGKRIPDNN